MRHDPSPFGLHLTILDQDPVPVGRYGCDYEWRHNYVAYRPIPLLWIDDASYAEYQSDCVDGN